MAKVKKICRICGKEYTPCGYCENDKMAFHYRTICCSRECAIIYFARVEEARGHKIENMSSVDHAMKTIGSKNDNGKRVAKSPNVKKRISKNNNLSSDFINANTGESDNGEQIEKSVGTSN